MDRFGLVQPELNKSASRAAPLLAPAASNMSHESIYCAIYATPRSTLRTETVGLLRESHKTWIPRNRGTARTCGLPNLTNTSSVRPPEVLHASFPATGRAISDLVKGAMNRSSVGTLVERISRSVMLVELDGNTASASKPPSADDRRGPCSPIAAPAIREVLVKRCWLC